MMLIGFGMIMASPAAVMSMALKIRVSYDPEGAVCDELGAFVGVDADSPGFAHRVLGGNGAQDADHGDCEAGDMQPARVERGDVVDSGDGSDRCGEADEDRDAEADLCPPLRCVGLGLEAESAVAGASPLVDRPPPEGKRRPEDVEGEGGDGHVGPSVRVVLLSVQLHRYTVSYGFPSQGFRC